MSKVTDRVKSLFRRRKPVTKEEATRLSSWVNEGGAPDPEGPPPVIDDDRPGE